MAKHAQKGEKILPAFNALTDEVNARGVHGGPLGGALSQLGHVQVPVRPLLRLVQAIQRAQLGQDSQEDSDEFDSDTLVWSQKCRFVTIRQTVGYARDDEDDIVRVYFPTALRWLKSGNYAATPMEYVQTAHDSWGGTFEEGDRFWVIFNDGTGRWEYLGPTQNVVRIQLTTALAAGSTATARVLWSNVDEAAPSVQDATLEITVHDYTGQADADSGDKGYALRMPDLGRWEAIMPTPQPDQQFTKLIYLCKEVSQSVTGAVDTPLWFTNSRNFSTANHNHFTQFLDGGDRISGIRLKKVGWYLLGMDIHAISANSTPGGGAVSFDTLSLGAAMYTSINGTGTQTLVDCAAKDLYLVKENSTGQCLGNFNASHVALYRNTDDTNVVKIRLQATLGSSTITFPDGGKNVFYASYLHDLTVEEYEP